MDANQLKNALDKMDERDVLGYRPYWERLVSAAPSLAQRVIAAERLVNAIEGMCAGTYTGPILPLVKAYREAGRPMQDEKPTTPEESEKEFADYDSGLLSDFGGGDVNWWHDYLRAEIGRANDFWRAQLEGNK